MADEVKVTGTVKDLGMAAFLKMKGYELIRRNGREFDFRILESEQAEFSLAQIEYVNSAFADFDSQIMNLKKL